MLFPYQFVSHRMDKMQEFMDFIFHEVWCRAPNGGSFSFDLFNAKPDLKALVEQFHYSDTKGADFFNGHVQRIYGHFAAQTPTQIAALKQWYVANNDIEKACANDPATQLARYPDIRAISNPLGDELAAFFKGLYSADLLGLSAVRDVIGDIDDRYDCFMTANQLGKCPFCGIGDIKGVHHTKRDAYDHYLPKAIYPFNSINFWNLVPACHECNSNYKLAKDPLFLKGEARRAFYPYSSANHRIEIEVELSKPDIDKLTPSDVRITAGPPALAEEVSTWMDLYGIEERYKAKCCSNGDGKYWLTLVLDEWRNDGRSPREFLRTLSRQTANAPFSESNFLKLAFLEGCNRIGLFDGPGSSG